MLAFDLERISDSDDIGSYAVSKIEMDRSKGLVTIYTKTATSSQHERSEYFLQGLKKILENFKGQLEFDHPSEVHRQLFHILGLPGQYENHFHISFGDNELENKYDDIIQALSAISNGVHPDLMTALTKYDPEFKSQKTIAEYREDDFGDSDIFGDSMSIFFTGSSEKENINRSNAQYESHEKPQKTSSYKTIR